MYPSKFRREAIRIESATPNCKLDAWIFEPDGDRPREIPVIVMAHGVGCNKELGLASYAEAFSSAGYACVVFDFRRWGQSDGEPRNCAVVSEQLEDYATIVAYCRQRPGFNPQKIVLWGYSFSGGHVLTLAAQSELNVCATIGQTPYPGRPFGFTLTLTCFRRILYALADVAKQTLGLGAVYIPTAAPFGQVGAVTAPGAEVGFMRLPQAARSASCFMIISASIYLRSPLYRPAETASSISKPILLIAGQQDNICPVERIRQVSRLAPNAELVEIPGGHAMGSSSDNDASTDTIPLVELSSHPPCPASAPSATQSPPVEDVVAVAYRRLQGQLDVLDFINRRIDERERGRVIRPLPHQEQIPPPTSIKEHHAMQSGTEVDIGRLNLPRQRISRSDRLTHEESCSTSPQGSLHPRLHGLSAEDVYQQTLRRKPTHEAHYRF
ncbi:hypothetical protein ONZ45_g9015 [Pleurotus djamor]|nr:hypothetical protein ONZ45_g9015 [Pleurotus djamor]